MATDGAEATIPQLAAQTGIPASSVYRLLAELERHGLVVRTTATKVALGIRLIAVGRDAEAGLHKRLVRPAQSIMEELCRETEETVIMTAPCALEALVLHVVETQSHSVRLSYVRFRRGSLDRGASAKVLAAWLSDADRRRLLRSVEEPGVLAQALEVIRRDGFAYTANELDEGAAAVAAPILDHRGQLAAGLSVAGPVERIHGRVEPLAAQVQSAARAIEARLRRSIRPVAS